MNIFTANQVSQIYFLLHSNDSYKDLNETTVFESVEDLQNPGDFFTTVTNDGDFYVTQMGQGGVVRTDLIPLKNVEYFNTTARKDTFYQTKLYQITIASGHSLVAGEDYMLRLAFDNYLGISPEDSQYWKYGAVRVTDNMSASNFYKAMAISLYKNMARESFKPILIGLNTANGGVEVNAASLNSLNGTYTGILIAEKEPQWILGTKQEKRIQLTITPIPLEIPSGTNPYKLIETEWGNVTELEAPAGRTIVPNGKMVADLEYFWMGERGDQYRMVGFPDYIPTKYFADPSKAYYIMRVHYSYIGSNESVQKSEKDLILISPYALVLKSVATALNGGTAPSGSPAQEPDAVVAGGDPFAIGD